MHGVRLVEIITFSTSSHKNGFQFWIIKKLKTSSFSFYDLIILTTSAKISKMVRFHEGGEEK
jgi:hypothetical protein